MNGSKGPAAGPTDHRQGERTGKQTGLRGCLELILKILIALILIAIFVAGWLRTGELNLLALILLLLLIALLIWLILRQKHLVMLNCGLTKPTGCVHGDANLLATYVLEPIVGTASGIGFSRYELEVIYDGTLSIPAAVIYADVGGNPDLALTTGNHQVTNGTLGFVNVKQAVLAAGAGFLSSTNYEVRLHIVGIDGSRKTCTIAFQISAARAFIKKAGTAWAHDVLAPSEILRRVEPPTGAPTDPASIGGGVYVRGSASAYGCAGEKIAELHLWAIPDPTFAFAQPANGTPSAPPAGGVQISEVIFTTDDQRNANPLDGISSGGDILTYAPGWTTRTEWIIVDLGIAIPIIVPDIVEITWATGASGKYTLLLEVKDTAGNTSYDIQRVWVDNDSPTAKITSIGGLAACVDLKLSAYKNTTAEIRGVAWDLPIVASNPQAPPNENFGSYGLSFQKNGGAGGTIPAALTPNTRVPNVWPGPLAPAADGILATWDIVAALDGGISPGPEKLPRGERCAYVIGLGVTDTTLVGEGGVNHHATHLYAINIINDL